jgi:leader peptidase (prepilin peptidase)/N-methyltransferase
MLINTGAVDFRIRMIYTGEMVVATLLALALAQVTGIGWLSSILGLVTALILFILLFLLAKMLFRGHAAPFGLGDVYLAAFIGALVGFLDLPTALFYGMLMAGLVALALILLRAAGRDVPTYIAYGTYLCLGVLLFLVTRA